MPKGTKKLSAKAKADVDRVRRLLLSGDERHYQTARKVIRSYKSEDLASFQSADILDRIKRWIENSGVDVKSQDFIEETVKQARQGAFLIANDWFDTAIAARALRYGGRFYLAHRRYSLAIERMGGTGKMDERKAEVLADYAEFWGYLGYTDRALAIFDRIPEAWQKGWLRWAKAFVLHQAAFVSRFPMGAPVSKPVGEIAYYLQSNYQLDRAQSGLNDKEKADSLLLRAANWGGIIERLKVDKADKSDVTAAEQEAACAMAGFRDGALVNKFWTWQKEQRGSMVRRWVRGIDDAWLDPGDIKRWRTSLVDHYRANLKAAGLENKLDEKPPIGLEDGNSFNPNDPGDDEEKPE